jgi:hypothetical protein
MEHATLHILASKNPGVKFAGYSDARGFRIMGNVSPQDVQQAVDEALVRLQNGEKSLAYHPNCGTNYATAGLMAGLAGWAGMLDCGKTLRDKLNRLPLVVLLATLVLIISRPLGPFLQRTVTTNPVPGTLRIMEIKRHDFGSFVLHRVLTKD